MFPKYALYSSSNLLNNNISLVTGYHATWYFIVLMVNAGQSIPGIVSQQFPMVRVITGYFSAVGIHFFVFRVILYLSPGRKRLENRRKLQTLTKLCHSRLLIEGLYEYRVPGIHYAGIAFGFFFFFPFFFCLTFTFPDSGRAVASGVAPFPPRYDVPSVSIAHRVQRSRCSSTFLECCYIS